MGTTVDIHGEVTSTERAYARRQLAHLQHDAPLLVDADIHLCLRAGSSSADPAARAMVVIVAGGHAIDAVARAGNVFTALDMLVARLRPRLHELARSGVPGQLVP